MRKGSKQWDFWYHTMRGTAHDPIEDFGYLGGVLYCEDTPICKFKFNHKRLLKSELQIYEVDEWTKPIEFHKGINSESLKWFLDEQYLTGLYTHDVHVFLKSLDKCIFTYEKWLRMSECGSCQNHYWVKCDNDMRCWEPWQIEELIKMGKLPVK